MDVICGAGASVDNWKARQRLRERYQLGRLCRNTTTWLSTRGDRKRLDCLKPLPRTKQLASCARRAFFRRASTKRPKAVLTGRSPDARQRWLASRDHVREPALFSFKAKRLSRRF